MKKLLICLALVLFGCQKDKTSTPSPVTPPSPGGDPIEKMYTATALAGSHGSISPLTKTVKAGDSIKYSIKADTGYNISSILVDGENVLKSDTSGPFEYVLKKIESNHMITVGFIKFSSSPPIYPPHLDSLTLHQIDSINNLLFGRWYTKKFQFKIIDSAAHDYWHDYTMPSCEADDYDLYNTNHTYVSLQNGTFCEIKKDTLSKGVWNLYPNGKGFVVNLSDGTKGSISIITLTLDSLVTLIIQQGHVGWKAYNVH
jgi:hypothetical protein